MDELIHHHGTPVTPRERLLDLAGRHFCVSFAEPRDVVIAHRIERLAVGLGDLRERTRDTNLDWRVDRLCEEAYWLFPRLTAADYVRRGEPVEHALVLADRDELRLRRMLHEDERSLRLSGLIR